MRQQLLRFLLAITLSQFTYGQVGDFNGDGLFDCDDIELLTLSLNDGDPTNDVEFDLTGDGVLDFHDHDEWVSGNNLLDGDANMDGNVDVLDFNRWNANKFTVNHSFCEGDFNGDASVDVGDLMLWNSNKFTSSNSPGRLFPDHGALDGMVDFAYDPATGYLTMDTDGTGVFCFTLKGESPLEIVSFPNGFQEDDTIWVQSTYRENAKWFSLDESHIDGTFVLARYETGLTAEDFEGATYGNAILETGFSSITILGAAAASPLAVPEPSGLSMTLISLIVTLGWRRPSTQGL
jgi:hypothetical protein